ncbi:3564_t:CDS:2, partial [Funneliformis geosporum]
KNYPKEGICVRKSYQEKHNFGKKRKKITKLDIKRESLEDKLNLNDFTNLKKLNCESNKLTGLNLTNCEKLEKVNCCDNLLTIGTLLTDPTNLKKLNLSNNPLTGNLDFLTNFKRLKYLDISDTDFNRVNVDKLPKSLEKIEYSTKKRPDCKLVEIVPQLDKYFTKFGGFSKIYKARNWLLDEEVILKSLTNSQNITLEFLTEITNARLVRSSNIIPIYGISQNPKTKNYVM